jgi:uncharacterized membrane protein
MQTIKETIEWRLIAIAITFVITYLWIGKLIEATGLTIALNLAKTIIYYIWRKIKLGHMNSTINLIKDKALNFLKRTIKGQNKKIKIEKI